MILDTNAVAAFSEDVPAVCMGVGESEVLGGKAMITGLRRRI